MRQKAHVRFLGGSRPVTAGSYPTSRLNASLGGSQTATHALETPPYRPEHPQALLPAPDIEGMESKA